MPISVFKDPVTTSLQTGTSPGIIPSPCSESSRGIKEATKELCGDMEIQRPCWGSAFSELHFGEISLDLVEESYF